MTQEDELHESAAGSDEDWGFETQGSGMSKEMKIGLPILLALICAFGFVAYKKLNSDDIDPAEEISSTAEFGEAGAFPGEEFSEDATEDTTEDNTGVVVTPTGDSFAESDTEGFDGQFNPPTGQVEPDETTELVDSGSSTFEDPASSTQYTTDPTDATFDDTSSTLASTPVGTETFDAETEERRDVFGARPTSPDVAEPDDTYSPTSDGVFTDTTETTETSGVGLSETGSEEITFQDNESTPSIDDGAFGASDGSLDTETMQPESGTFGSDVALDEETPTVDSSFGGDFTPDSGLDRPDFDSKADIDSSIGSTESDTGFGTTTDTADSGFGSSTGLDNPVEINERLGGYERVDAGAASAGSETIVTAEEDNGFGGTGSESGSTFGSDVSDSHPSDFETPLSDNTGSFGDPSSFENPKSDFTSESTALSQDIGGNTYEIQKSDNYWTISRKLYGEGRFFQALAEHNKSKVKDPKRMRPGTVISTPSVEVLQQLYARYIPKGAPRSTVAQDKRGISKRFEPKMVSETTGSSSKKSIRQGFYYENGQPMYRVGSNDTLSEIAEQHLGRASRYIQIQNLNRDRVHNPDNLEVGTALVLPRDASEVQLVRRPRSRRY